MRLHLIIQRHGLPVTRILWTTTASSLEATTSYRSPGTSSAIASTRVPNAIFANGGYTIAQLLEDVNEVVPLETEPSMFGGSSSGQWGLEDYVVEVAGSEGLHFMEVEGLLRDGDEVVIRALQISDLRVRRVSGRHQISMDGRHLIDGVPFGRPYMKRASSSRPAISIPPRKKRRTLYGSSAGYEEEDTEWAPAEHGITGKELSVLPDNLGEDDEEQDEDYYEDYHEGEPEEDEDGGDETVIRHPIEETEQAHLSESDPGGSDLEAEDLAQELQGLKEDMHMSGLDVEALDEEQPSRLRLTKSPEQPEQTGISAEKSPSLASRITNESPGGASLALKSVRFERQGKKESPASYKKSPASVKDSAPEVSSSSDESVSSESDSDSDSDASSNEDKLPVSDSASDSDSEDSSSDSSSDSEDEIPVVETKVNPPGGGSLRTKKSNQRNKLRRRLSKLKEFGVLPEKADFSTLREWETTNGNWDFNIEAKPATGGKRQAKEQEQAEFEAKRQRLLRDLELGDGVDIDAFAEKENIPSAQGVKKEKHQAQPEEATAIDHVDPVEYSKKKRSLDVASSKRMLFGSLGVRTPRSKEDEEVTRKKLAGNVNNFQSQRTAEVQEERQPVEEAAEKECDADENWEDKLIIRATECVMDDIQLTAPPFPFAQRWDNKAHEIISQRKGWGKKRKRKQRTQVYDEPEEEWYDNDYGDGYDNSYETRYENGNGEYENGEMQLTYDDTEQLGEGPTEMDGVEQTAAEVSESTEDELPPLPDDISSIPDLVEDDLKKESVIAFKQLDMSKETNWQPQVSEYRVAEIHDIFEDGIINVRLARRYRRQRKDSGYGDGYDDDYDEGPREYSGFEMPGFEDDEEDNGFREMAFAELIEPMLLRAADRAADGAGKDGDAQKVSISSVVEESVENPPPSGSVVVEIPSVLYLQSYSTDKYHPPSAQNPDLPVQTDGVNDTVNEEVVDSPANDETRDSPAVKSPKFAGFRSPLKFSPEREVSESSDAAAGRQGNGNENDHQSSPEREVSESTDAAAGQQEDSNDKTQQSGSHIPVNNDEQSTGDWSMPPNAYDENDGPVFNSNDMRPLSSPHSLVSFNGLLDQSFQDNEFALDSTPPAKRGGEKSKNSSKRTRSPSSQGSYVPNPFYAIDRAYEERQQPSKTEYPVCDAAEDTMDMDADPSFVGFSFSSPAPRKSRRRSQRPSKKSAPPSRETSSPISFVPESQWQDAKGKDADATQPHFSASQMSEIVDLTQSSPGASPEGRDEDSAKSNGLPRGSGWVQKNMPKSKSKVKPKPKTKSQRRAQTLKEVSISPPIPKHSRRRT